MSLTPQTQTILLLTSHFSKSEENEVKPLTRKEWGRFAIWLKQQNMKPEQLLINSLQEQLATWQDKTISIERVEQLLNRGTALAIAMEKWTRAGLWVISRTDETYPLYLKKRLKSDSPAILFGCGNQNLLNQKGIAVVGSRHASEEDLKFSEQLGKMTAEQDVTLISGGAKGVDEAAMFGALTQGGTVIGVLADGLLKTCCAARYRNFLVTDRLALISPFYPEAGFSVGTAMSRNKYIYCLSESAVVVHSDTQGGTWTGASENIKNQWVKLWVKPSSDPMSGNFELVKSGGSWLSESILSQPSLLYALTTNTSEIDSPRSQELLFEKRETVLDSYKPSWSNLDFYAFFLLKMQEICDSQARTSEELVAQLNIKKNQLESWLKQAVADKKIQKFSKPTRYQWKQV